MDLVYSLFYEVLSEQGIWVLILIASAFAVASFILLALRMETNAKQGGTSTLINKTQKKPWGVKARKKGKEKEKEKEEPILREEESTPEPKVAAQLDPRMTPPENLTPPEVILPGSAASKYIPQPTTEPAPEPEPKPVIDPFEVVPITETEQASQPELEAASEKGAVSMAGGGGAAQETVGGAVSVGADQIPDEGLLEPQKSKDGENILDLFNVEEENEQLSDFAKRLDDVAIPSLLTETEELVQQLRNRTKSKRRA